MIIKFSDDLLEQEIFANGDELAQIMGYDRDEKGNRIYSCPDDKKVSVVTFDEPVLMTDNDRIAKLDPVLRDTVFALYSSPVKRIEYGNVSLRFEQDKYPGVWGPSIDTLLFCRGLKKAGLENVEDVVEIGCGSGFVSKYVLCNAPDIKNMTLVDINNYAIGCAYDNIDDERATFVAGNGIDHIYGKMYDLIVCNPPYIPRPESIDDNAYEGLELLHYLIDNATEHLNEDGRLIVNISSMSKKQTYELIKDSGVKAREIDAMCVPLKVYNVLNNQEWKDYLLDTGRLRKERRSGYDYWQRIAITEIRI
ncbi:MAG: class I SAM-dependent methyltransferase [archaeon]